MYSKISFAISIVLTWCATTVVETNSHIEYLDGFQRFNTTTIDYYFSCTATGVFMQWSYNNDSLPGFEVGGLGRVSVGARGDYEYVITLLSSEIQDGRATFVSVLVISRNGIHQDFDVTCSTLKTSVTATANHTRHANNTKEESGIILDFVRSAKIVDENRTHIFVCCVPNAFHFLTVNSTDIGFSNADPIGSHHTKISENNKSIDLQGILIARHPFRSTSLLFVTDRYDVTVTCYYESNQVQLSSLTPATTASTTKSVVDTTSDMTFDSTEFIKVTSNVIGYLVGAPLVVLVVIIVLIIVLGCAYWWHKKRSRNKKYDVHNSEIKEWLDIQKQLKTSTYEGETWSKEASTTTMKKTILGADVAAKEGNLQDYNGAIKILNDEGAGEETTLQSNSNENKPVNGTRLLWKEDYIKFGSMRRSGEQRGSVQPSHQDYELVPSTNWKAVPFSISCGEDKLQQNSKSSASSSASVTPPSASVTPPSASVTPVASCMVSSEGK